MVSPSDSDYGESLPKEFIAEATRAGFRSVTVQTVQTVQTRTLKETPVRQTMEGATIWSPWTHWWLILVGSKLPIFWGK